MTHFEGATPVGTITTSDGIDIFYKDWGSGQPIVFSHGWPLSADDWDNQLLFFLQQGYRVVAHDRRGHGRSTQTADGHDMDHYADDLAAVVEHALRQALGVGVGLDHQRRHRTDQYRFRHAALTVSGDVVHDFAATGGVPDVDGVLQIEMGRKRSQVVGVMVHVVTVAGLRGASVPAPVVGDDAVTLL